MDSEQRGLVGAPHQSHRRRVAVNNAVIVKQQVGVGRLLEQDPEPLFRLGAFGDVERDADDSADRAALVPLRLQRHMEAERPIAHIKGHRFARKSAPGAVQHSRIAAAEVIHRPAYSLAGRKAESRQPRAFRQRNRAFGVGGIQDDRNAAEDCPCGLLTAAQRFFQNLVIGDVLSIAENLPGSPIRPALEDHFPFP